MQPTPLITVPMFAALAGTVVGAVTLWARRSGGAVTGRQGSPRRPFSRQNRPRPAPILRHQLYK